MKRQNDPDFKQWFKAVTDLKATRDESASWSQSLNEIQFQESEKRMRSLKSLKKRMFFQVGLSLGVGIILGASLSEIRSSFRSPERPSQISFAENSKKTFDDATYEHTHSNLD